MASPSRVQTASTRRWRTSIPPLAVPLLGLLSVAAAADPVNVRVQPSGNSAATSYVLVNEARTFFGNVAGGSGSYQCQWTLEGVAQPAFSPTDPHYIAVDHTITTSGAKNLTLRCEDANDASDFDSATIQVLALSSDNPTRQKNSAIDKGLRYLYRQQDAASGCFAGQNYPSASTGMALIALQNHGHNLDADDEDIYKGPMQRGLQCLFDHSATVDVGAQPCIGDPEAGTEGAVGDGKGIDFAPGDWDSMYSNGITLLALVNATTEANAKTLFPTTASGSDQINGAKSLWQIAVDAKDFLAWAQTDEGPDGGGGAGQTCEAYDADRWLGAILGRGYGLTWSFDGYAYLSNVFPDFPITCGDGPWPWAFDFGNGTTAGPQDSFCAFGDDQSATYVDNYFLDGGDREVTVTYGEPDAGSQTVTVSFNDQPVCTMTVTVGGGASQTSCDAYDADGNYLGYIQAATADGFTWAFDGYVEVPEVFQPRCSDGPWPWAVTYGDGASDGPQDSVCAWDNDYAFIQDGYPDGGGQEFTHTFPGFGNYTVAFSFNDGAFCSLDIEVTEPGDCGVNAWRYDANDNSIDNSAAQWPILGLLEAERRWHIGVSQAVKDEAEGWLNASQDDGTCDPSNPGSYGYDWRCSWLNFAKAAAGLIMRDWTGHPATSPENQLTLNYLGNTYGTTCTWDDCNKGALYSMYAFFKGMKLYDLPTLPVPAGGPPLAWQPDYDAYLVSIQDADGSWPITYWISSPVMTTYFALAILAPEVSGLPPVANAGGPYGPVAPASPFPMDGSQSTHLDPSRSLIKYEWDFNAADGLWWDTKPAPDANEGAFGQTATNPGYPDTGLDATYTITLRVTDDATPPATDTDATTVSVTTSNVPPTAVTNGPWAGVPSTDPACSPTDPNAVNNAACYPITFDGSASFDANGDAIAAYAWDIDGDGQFNETNGDDGWPQGTAGTPGHWRVVKKLYTGPASGLATLRVTEATPAALTGVASNQFVSVAFVYSTNYAACYNVRLGRFVQQQGIAVTFTNIGDGLAENVRMTLSRTPSNVVAVKNVANLGNMGPGAVVTSACGGTLATSDIVRNTLLNVPPGGEYRWTADFDFNGVHYTVPNLPAMP